MAQEPEATPPDTPDSTEAVPAPTRACPSCGGPIPLGAQRCLRCGMTRGLTRVATTGVKWAGAVLTVIALAMGIRQLIGTAGAAIERRSELGTRVEVAERLREAGEYGPAWVVLEPLMDSRDDAVREARLALARDWVLHARALEGRSTFLEITDRVSPVIAASATAGPGRRRAEYHALLGHIQLLRAREQPIQGDPASAYREALEIDPDCALAHLLLGSYLVVWTGELDDGLAYLRRAVELEREGQLEDVSAREWQLNSIINHIRSNPFVPNPSYDEGVTALVRTLHELRGRGEPLPVPSNMVDRIHVEGPGNPFVSHVRSVYSSKLPTDEQFAGPLRRAIPLEEHIALLEWLQELASADAPDPWLAAWTASFQEALGDTAAAVETYRSVAVVPSRLGTLWDEAMVRLTGHPHRPLSERDPWSHTTLVLGSAEPETEEFRAALEHLDRYMESHRLGGRDADQGAAGAARAALDNLSGREGSSGADSAAANRYARVAVSLGRLLLETDRPDEAVAVLEEVSGRPGARHALRGEALVALAVAYGRRSGTVSAGTGDLDRAVARLREAVEEAGYVDWARIRWLDDLRPVRSHPDYAALLARHGRAVDGPFGRVRQDDR